MTRPSVSLCRAMIAHLGATGEERLAPGEERRSRARTGPGPHLRAAGAVTAGAPVTSEIRSEPSLLDYVRGDIGEKAQFEAKGVSGDAHSGPCWFWLPSLLGRRHARIVLG